jgi:hypothetical protein
VSYGWTNDQPTNDSFVWANQEAIDTDIMTLPTEIYDALTNEKFDKCVRNKEEKAFGFAK